MKTTTALAGAIACFGLSMSSALAEEATLSIATTTPGDYVVAAKVVTPWADRINQAGAGILHITVRNGPTIAIAANVFDRVNADVVQMGVGIPGLVGGRFPLTDVVGLPFAVSDSEKGSIAFWHLYETGMLDSEYRDFLPLAMSMCPAQGVHLAKAPPSLDDLRGLRLRVASKLGADVVTQLHGTASAFDPADIYASIQRGLIDGATMAWTGMKQLNLNEVTSFHIETEFGTTADIIFISRRAYNALSPPARKLLDDNSGEVLSRAMGALYDDESRKARTPLLTSDKHKIVGLDPAQKRKWSDAIKPLIEAWTNDHPGGAKLLETYRTLLAEAESKP